MKRMNVLAATLAVLLATCGAALAQPEQHDQNSAARRTPNVALASNHGDFARTLRGSVSPTEQTRADRDGWNSSFVKARSRKDIIQKRDRDEGAAGQFWAAEARRSEGQFQQAREVHTRNMHPIRPGTSDNERF